jgi:mRNA-degrading endonuclease toxin of MazEF toxin-antitoxin module
VLVLPPVKPPFVSFPHPHITIIVVITTKSGGFGFGLAVMVSDGRGRRSCHAQIESTRLLKHRQ